MSFYKELEPFIEYIHSIRKLKNYLSIDLKFPTKWSIPKSVVEEGQVVGFESDDANFKGISFVTEITETSVNVTLTKIAKIIRLNKEKELKEKLFKQTIEPDQVVEQINHVQRGLVECIEREVMDLI